MKDKDAYDVYFCVANFPGGINASTVLRVRTDVVQQACRRAS